MSSSEQKLKKLLCQRGTLYRQCQPSVISSLSALGTELQLDSKKVVALFDKFMTIHRMNAESVSDADFEAFSSSSAILAKKANATTVFAAKTDWEDMDVSKIPKSAVANGAVAKGVKEASAGAAKTPLASQPNKGSAPSPILSRTPAELSEKRSGRFESHNGALQTSFNGSMMFERAQEAGEGEVEGEGEGEGDAKGGGGGERHQESFNVYNEPAPSTYMMNTLMSRVQYLDERIRAMERVVDAQIQPRKTRSIAAACQDTAVFCGRIVCDTEGGRLNPQSVMLEGSIATSRGARVRLDLQACGDYRLFPGQVVAVVGKNPTGFCIVAQEIVPSMPFPDAVVKANRDAALSKDASSFDMVVAAGPFTPTDSLVYEPLKAIIEYCEREKPSSLVLVGPFVDQDHPSISDGMLDATFEDVFALKVVDEIEKLQEKVPTMKVAMMPSIRDVHHDVAFPQRAFEMDDGCKTESLPNPATMRYRGTCIACSSVDWLMSCTKEEISKTSNKNVDRMSSLAAHVVQQQSYYPMFPTSANVCLDVSHPESFDMVGLPEIVLTPSDLAPFAKQATINDLRVNLDDESNPVKATGSHSVICVNPGRATKGATAGTFAHVYVNGASGSVAAEGIESRCRVDIKRI